MSWAGVSTSFGLGFVYFITAIPAGMAAGAPVWMAAVAAWLGYTAGGGVVLLAGAPLRDWLVRKLRIPVEHDPSKFIWRCWDRWGLAGLGLLAPVTIGPQATAVLGLAAGEKPLRIGAAISLGVLPWCVAFAALAALGVSLVK
ncbi:MAG: hypothetical protein IAE97_02050 [Chthoniobacterales bacterium]|nr:hypothetical protein [Chthoniobacterales bacterium]